MHWEARKLGPSRVWRKEPREGWGKSDRLSIHRAPQPSWAGSGALQISGCLSPRCSGPTQMKRKQDQPQRPHLGRWFFSCFFFSSSLKAICLLIFEKRLGVYWRLNSNSPSSRPNLPSTSAKVTGLRHILAFVAPFPASWTSGESLSPRAWIGGS